MNRVDITKTTTTTEIDAEDNDSQQLNLPEKTTYLTLFIDN
jgi:hypothetical protein